VVYCLPTVPSVPKAGIAPAASLVLSQCGLLSAYLGGSGTGGNCTHGIAGSRPTWSTVCLPCHFPWQEHCGFAAVPPLPRSH